MKKKESCQRGCHRRSVNQSDSEDYGGVTVDHRRGFIYFTYPGRKSGEQLGVAGPPDAHHRHLCVKLTNDNDNM